MHHGVVGFLRLRKLGDIVLEDERGLRPPAAIFGRGDILDVQPRAVLRERAGHAIEGFERRVLVPVNQAIVGHLRGVGHHRVPIVIETVDVAEYPVPRQNIHTAHPRADLQIARTVLQVLILACMDVLQVELDRSQLRGDYHDLCCDARDSIQLGYEGPRPRGCESHGTLGVALAGVLHLNEFFLIAVLVLCLEEHRGLIVVLFVALHGLDHIFVVVEHVGAENLSRRAGRQLASARHVPSALCEVVLAILVGLVRIANEIREAGVGDVNRQNGDVGARTEGILEEKALDVEDAGRPQGRVHSERVIALVPQDMPVVELRAVCVSEHALEGDVRVGGFEAFRVVRIHLQRHALARRVDLRVARVPARARDAVRGVRRGLHERVDEQVGVVVEFAGVHFELHVGVRVLGRHASRA